MSYRRVTRFVTTPNGTRIAYHTHSGNLPEDRAEQEMASRPAVLLTNGIGTSENFWRYIVANLEQDHRVVHWNYRGHGHSDEARDGDYSVQAHMEDLERVTEAMMALGNGRPPHHIAFSMGVRVVLELYRRRPDLVAALTLIAGPPSAPGAWRQGLGMQLWLRTMKRAMHAAGPLLPWVTPMVRAFLASPLAYPAGRFTGALRPRAPRADLDEFFAALRQMSPEAYWKTLEGLMVGSSWDVMARVQVPTQIIAAAHDQLVPLSDMERMREVLPHARFLLVEDAGHAGLVEAGSEIADAVRIFLVEQGVEPAAMAP
ncbi:alpha/beta fold hydrolase [Hyalangium rubrum]|uniref:Alpha/beta hydrolase n=1 Tax=Hyalangium rubrum TaxID=3103134 RepID=A0ABU5HBZ1_9BACT|nr:alpha/beta hydrolase [Hyalangium sp. s54d21]MDY7230978.1 alpha/beta hydrolase [Hyalangium sp. s54d21]